MQCVILAGGKGSRISEETFDKPKPLIRIGNKPILLHIINIYQRFGVKEFIICLGYKGDQIKDYFLNYKYYENNFEIDYNDAKVNILTKNSLKNLKISLINTGLESNTGERLKRVEKYIKNKNFYFTYGDGVGKIEIDKLTKLHERKGKMVTMTLSHPSGRWGVVNVKPNNIITSFKEKVSTSSWVNSGFFVINSNIFNLLKKYKNPIFEKEPLENLSKKNQLIGFKNNNFWHPVDTMRDKNFLENIYKKNGDWYKVK
jgi:glucose-1-phosphate cytidylyltransferase